MQISGLSANPLVSRYCLSETVPVSLDARPSASVAQNFALQNIHGGRTLSSRSAQIALERMREQVMKELGLTEDDLASMTADEKRVAEDKIREMIEEKLKQGMRNGDGEADNAGQVVLDAALG
jgi:hypothetical protein